MRSPLTGLGRGFWPAPHVCHGCGSAQNACRGFPGDVWYCTPCVPPDLRSPWEPGYAPAPAPADMLAIVAPRASARAADLLSGLAPA